jgi:hypothetical protein
MAWQRKLMRHTFVHAPHDLPVATNSGAAPRRERQQTLDTVPPIISVVQLKVSPRVTPSNESAINALRLESSSHNGCLLKLHLISRLTFSLFRPTFIGPNPDFSTVTSFKIGKVSAESASDRDIFISRTKATWLDIQFQC